MIEEHGTAFNHTKGAPEFDATTVAVFHEEDNRPGIFGNVTQRDVVTIATEVRKNQRRLVPDPKESLRAAPLLNVRLALSVRCAKIEHIQISEKPVRPCAALPLLSHFCSCGIFCFPHWGLLPLVRISGADGMAGRWDANTLAAELECSRRTGYRLLQALSMAGVPWYYDDDCRSYRVRPGLRFPGLEEKPASRPRELDLKPLHIAANQLLQDGEKFIDSLPAFCEQLNQHKPDH